MINSSSMEISCDIMQNDSSDPRSERTDFPSPLELSTGLARDQQELHCLDTDGDYGPEGYGPQFIAEETEIVAAEPQIDLEKKIDDYEGGLQNGVENCTTVIAGGVTQNLNHGIRSEDLSELDEVTSSSLADTMYTIKQEPVILQSTSADEVSTGAISLSDGSTLMPGYLSCGPEVGSVQLLLTQGQLQLMAGIPSGTPLSPAGGYTVHPAHTIDNCRKVPSEKEWANREEKRARDREKKRLQRADPVYKQKEREKSLQRMRLRRLDPVYRSVERVRDRIRRKISRRDKPDIREAEKERDRMSKRLHRLRMHVLDAQVKPGFLEEGEIPSSEKIIVETVHGCVISGNNVESTMLSAQSESEILVGNCHDPIGRGEHFISENEVASSTEDLDDDDC